MHVYCDSTCEPSRWLNWWHRLESHLDNPYPTEPEKRALAADAGLEVERVSTWFINARVRELGAMRARRAAARSGLGR